MNFRVLLHDISASDARVTRLAQSIAPLLGVEAEQLVGRATGRPAWLLDLTDRDGAEQVAQAIYAARTNAPDANQQLIDLANNATINELARSTALGLLENYPNMFLTVPQ